jgi:predicted RNA methylase
MRAFLTPQRPARFLIALLTLLSSGSTAGTQGVRIPDIGYEPTPPAVVDKMLELAHVGPGDTVYDLGSGDGRIVIAAAKRYGARGVGIELQPGLIRASRQAALDAGVADKVTFVEADFFGVDISPATVVMLYLWPTLNDRLDAELRRELLPGARNGSYTFGMSDWVPDSSVRADNGRDVWLWVVPRPPSREPDVPFTPTPQPTVEQILQLAHVGPGDVVVDLGSGDGRIPVVAAQTYGARGVGIEIVPSLVERSKRIAQDAGLTDRVTFIEGDLFDADLSRATVVVLCLSAQVNAKLESRLRRLTPGTRVVSRQFPIGTWPPDTSVKAQDGSRLFLWTVRRPPRAP